MVPIDPSEITPEHVYISRRRFMKGLGALTIGQAVLAACGTPTRRSTPGAGASAGAPDAGAAAPIDAAPIEAVAAASADELGDPITEFESVTTYNNFYEYSTHKDGPAKLAGDLRTSPWTVEVGGLVAQPGPLDVAELKQAFVQEERVYRLRCVEGWSMVIPWIGFPLHKLLAMVQPLPEAAYVRFETLLDPAQFPNQSGKVLPWPYVEGLRLDEAENDLTLLATGLYGRDLLPQNGAPIRLVVPWKYGFKSIKSIVKIDLVADQPANTWAVLTPNEYGFYANVNPEVDHPRWSQATERRIGDFGRRRTLMFNGYEDEVAHLYEGMDLSVHF